MAKSKWGEVKNRLNEVEQWAREGLIDTEIASRLGISTATFYNYQLEHLEFVEVIKRGKSHADYTVEQALYKRALGYEYEEVTEEIDDAGARRATKIVTKHVIPDTTAQIFWLKNRKPEAWRDKQEVGISSASSEAQRELKEYMELLKAEKG